MLSFKMNKNKLLVASMSFSVKQWTTARFIERAAVLCSEECQKAAIVMSGSRRCGIKRRVFGVGFTTRAMDFTPEPN